MKNYDCSKIKSLVSEGVDTIELGMCEDWGWTAQTVFKDGEFNIDLSGETVSISGISGSTWASPTAKVTYDEGRTEKVDVWKDDGDKASAEQIRRQKRFAQATGGMDNLMDGVN